ncbi:MAG: transglutaminase-like domain-containing protein, partial [Thermoleophilaceae bacterium]
MIAPAAGAERLALRLAVFAALAIFASAHWARLLDDPPIASTAASVLIATAGGLALARLGRIRHSRLTVVGLGGLVVLAVVAAELLAAGIPAQTLLPSGWSTLAAGIEHGLGSLDRVDWPYDGPDEWIRRAVLLSGPLVLAAAAAVTFWPGEGGAGRSALGLAMLVGLYAVAVVTDDPGTPLLRGLGLLTLISAWLWLPQLRLRDAAPAVVALVVAAAFAVPIAVAADGDRPLIDYRSWTLFGADEVVSFDWNHEYGPLDWPRTGTTILLAESDEPHYWKVAALSEFDGTRWEQGVATAGDGAEPPFGGGSSGGDGGRDQQAYDVAWSERISFTIKALATDVVVGAGLTYAVDGIQASAAPDGSIALLGAPLERGDTYRIRAYDPDPGAGELLAAPDDYPEELRRETTVTLPLAVEDPRRRPPATESAPLGEVTVTVPLRGSADATVRQRERVDDLLRRSAYGGSYALAQRLTAGAAAPYEAVQSIERHLRDNYRYRELVPDRRYPLEAFLFKDGRGYCQQFSGAMTLMLRMVGIPARVAAGFSPGAYDRDERAYRVRDLDAHSWVEVYFAGIGWVPFDPTPTAAPATSQTGGELGAIGAAAGELRLEDDDSPRPDAPADEPIAEEPEPRDGPGVAAGGGGGPRGSVVSAGAVVAGALLAALLATAIAAVATRCVRRSRLAPADLADAQLAELRRALTRLGWELAESTTLAGLERRLGAAVGPSAA